VVCQLNFLVIRSFFKQTCPERRTRSAPSTRHNRYASRDRVHLVALPSRHRNPYRWPSLRPLSGQCATGQWQCRTNGRYGRSCKMAMAIGDCWINLCVNFIFLDNIIGEVGENKAPEARWWVSVHNFRQLVNTEECFDFGVDAFRFLEKVSQRQSCGTGQNHRVIGGIQRAYIDIEAMTYLLK
jgi:hypothetical protein